MRLELHGLDQRGCGDAVAQSDRLLRREEPDPAVERWAAHDNDACAAETPTAFDASDYELRASIYAGRQHAEGRCEAELQVIDRAAHRDGREEYVATHSFPHLSRRRATRRVQRTR